MEDFKYGRAWVTVFVGITVFTESHSIFERIAKTLIIFIRHFFIHLFFIKDIN